MFLQLASITSPPEQCRCQSRYLPVCYFLKFLALFTIFFQVFPLFLQFPCLTREESAYERHVKQASRIEKLWQARWRLQLDIAHFDLGVYTKSELHASFMALGCLFLGDIITPVTQVEVIVTLPLKCFAFVKITFLQLFQVSDWEQCSQRYLKKGIQRHLLCSET